MIKKVIAGEKIELPQIAKNRKTVENEGTDPIFKISIAPTEKEGGRSSSKISKGYKQQEAESRTLHQILSMAYGVPTTRILGPRDTFRVAVRDLSQTADQSVRIAIPTSIDGIATIARFQPEKIC